MHSTLTFTISISLSLQCYTAISEKYFHSDMETSIYPINFINFWPSKKHLIKLLILMPLNKIKLQNISIVIE